MTISRDCGIDCDVCPKYEHCELVAKEDKTYSKTKVEDPDNPCPHHNNCSECEVFVDRVCQITEFYSGGKKETFQE